MSDRRGSAHLPGMTNPQTPIQRALAAARERTYPVGLVTDYRRCDDRALRVLRSLRAASAVETGAPR